MGIYIHGGVVFGWLDVGYALSDGAHCLGAMLTMFIHVYDRG